MTDRDAVGVALLSAAAGAAATWLLTRRTRSDDSPVVMAGGSMTFFTPQGKNLENLDPKTARHKEKNRVDSVDLIHGKIGSKPSVTPIAVLPQYAIRVQYGDDAAIIDISGQLTITSEKKQNLQVTGDEELVYPLMGKSDWISDININNQSWYRSSAPLGHDEYLLMIIHYR